MTLHRGCLEPGIQNEKYALLQEVAEKHYYSGSTVFSLALSLHTHTATVTITDI